MRSISLFLLCMLLPLTVWGQHISSQERPDWVNGTHIDRPNSYIEVTSAIGYNEENAREKAIRLISEKRSLATGRRVNITDRNGNTVVNSNDDLTVKCRIVDEYCEYLNDGSYRVSLLVQTAKNPMLEYEPVSVTKSYKFSPDVFVPGMAQIRKGSKTKGALFITGEIVAIGGIIVSECMRSSYENKISLTRDVATKRNYIDKVDMLATTRNVFIGAAAAIYVWNVIDGIVAKGKLHVEVGNSANLGFTPFVAPDVTGISLCFNF